MTYIGLNGGQKQAVVSDLNTRTHLITFFDNKYASSKDEEEWTLPDLAGEILHRNARAKAKLPWLKMAQFGEHRSIKNALRTDANMVAISGIELDYDAAVMPFDAAASAFEAAGLRVLLYTSASHIAGEREKWRVLAPLSGLFSPEAREGFAAAVNAIIGGVAARESFVKSTAFYYGFVRGNDGHRVEVLDGDFIDLRPDLLAVKAYPEPIARNTPKTPNLPKTPNVTPARDDEEIQKLLQASRKVNRQGERQWHNAMLAATASMIGRGWRDAEIYEACQAYCDGGWGDADIAELIRGGREKWKTPDPGVVDRMGPIVAQAIESTGYQVPEGEPDWLERYLNGRPKASVHNAMVALEARGVKCAEDVFHNKMFVSCEGAMVPFTGAVTDGGILTLRRWLLNCYRLDFTKKHVEDAVVMLARENRFNPVTDMLEAAEADWDGVARLDRMAADYFNAEDTALNAVCVRKVMIAAVARARRPGIKFDTILVMESPEGWNKSSVWALLAGDGNFSDERIIGHATREVQEQLAGVWIHENADLAGMRKAEVETVKAFASRQVDRARPAYGHFLVEQPRHSIEVGTTNADTYLQSMTGNRRFWPVMILKEIDLDKVRRDRLQLWGEAAHYQSNGESLVLPRELWNAAGEVQESRRVVHPWEGDLADLSPVVGHVKVVGDEWRVSTSGLFAYLGIPKTEQLRHAKALAEIMRVHGWKDKIFREGAKVVRGYVKLT